MDRLAVAAGARGWLTVRLREVGFKVVIPTSSKANLSVTLANGKKVEFQVLASSEPSFRVRRSMLEKPNSLLVYIWNVGDPENLAAFGMAPREALAFVEQEGYTKRRNWAAYRETGTITVEGKVQAWLEEHRLTQDALRRKIDEVYSPEAQINPEPK